MGHLHLGILSEVALGRRLRTVKAVCGLPSGVGLATAFGVVRTLLASLPGPQLALNVSAYRGGTWKNTGE